MKLPNLLVTSSLARAPERIPSTNSAESALNIGVEGHQRPHHGTPSHRRGHVFTAPRSGPAIGGRSVTQQRRRLLPGANPLDSQDDSNESFVKSSDDSMLPSDFGRITTLPQEKQRDESADKDHQEKKRERRFEAVALRSRVEPLTQSVRESTGDVESLQSVALNLLSLAARSNPKVPRLEAMLLAQRWMRAGSGTSSGETTLAAVRAALLAAGSVGAGSMAGSESARIWLPVYLLNLNRPRTLQRTQRAIGALDALRRTSTELPEAPGGK